jgi:hypothetical protein
MDFEMIEQEEEISLDEDEDDDEEDGDDNRGNNSDNSSENSGSDERDNNKSGASSGGKNSKKVRANVTSQTYQGTIHRVAPSDPEDADNAMYEVLWEDGEFLYYTEKEIKDAMAYYTAKYEPQDDCDDDADADGNADADDHISENLGADRSEIDGTEEQNSGTAQIAAAGRLDNSTHDRFHKRPASTSPDTNADSTMSKLMKIS